MERLLSSVDGHLATTSFEATSFWDVGAPGFKGISSKAGSYNVAPDEWVRLRWRGRFSDVDTGVWWYEHEHICINVARFEGEPKTHVFLDNQPTKEFVHLPHLR